ncbi:MAG: glycosyltransferase family A protein [Steroidobacteraceae bacterium]|nr:glycosyltransferase family A protein [Steroidobacteraceae bacterium]
MPRVSIVLPTWNRAAFVGHAIASVQQQTFEDWELALVDDGSTDATAQVVRAFLRDPRIRYLQKPRRGQAAARNAGIAATSARFVCFLDSDDFWPAGKLAEQVAVADDNPGFDVFYGEEDEVDAQARPLETRRMKRHAGDVLVPLLKDNFVPMSSAMVRRTALEAVGGFDEALRRADDYDLWLRLSLRHRFHYSPGTWSYCRVMPAQLSSDKEARFAANELIVDRVLARAADRLSPATARWARAMLQVRRSRYYASRGRSLLAASTALRSLALLPYSSLTWRALARSLLSGVAGGSGAPPNH